MIQNKWQDGQFKPSRRIILRKLTLNIRYIAALFVIGVEYLGRIIHSLNEGDPRNFLSSVADSQNILIIIFTTVILILAILFILIVISNIGAIIYGYLNYLTMYNEITPHIIYIQKGIIIKQRFEIPIHRITDIQIRIQPFDRILKTADIHFNTAKGSTIYMMQTLHQNDAYDIHKFVQNQIQRIDHEVDTSSYYSLFSDPRIIAELQEIRELITELYDTF